MHSRDREELAKSSLICNVSLLALLGAVVVAVVVMLNTLPVYPV